MSLIVNADDFGKTSQINMAIVECFRKGLINRTTIMVNMPYAEEAYELALKNGFVGKVGLHINLTEGMPLTEGIKKIPYFCDEDGTFNAAFYHNKRMRLYMDEADVTAIAEEIKAQLDEYKKLGFSLFHIDSHHHSHTNLPVIMAINSLRKQYRFSSIRQTRNLYRGGSVLNRIYKNFFNRRIKKMCKKTTDFFGSYEDAFEYFLNGDTFDNAQFVAFCQTNDLEIMVHPDYDESGNLIDTGVGPMNKLLTLN